MTPHVLDLCGGDGGWAEGFLAAGWIVFGVDIVRCRKYPAPMIRSARLRAKIPFELAYTVAQFHSNRLSGSVRSIAESVNESTLIPDSSTGCCVNLSTSPEVLAHA